MSCYLGHGVVYSHGVIESTQLMFLAVLHHILAVLHHR